MSKLLRETLLDNKNNKNNQSQNHNLYHKNLTNQANLETLTSETGFFETFVAKGDPPLDFRNANIKLRSSSAYKYKCLNKVHEASKYRGKIIFPIIETIIIDKGQINHWIFTDEIAGYVLKRNSNKLVKDFVLRYFISIALEKLTESGSKINKKVERIMEDIHRFVILSDQNYNAKKEFVGEFEYLEDFNALNFIYLKFIGNVEKMVNVFDLFSLLGDANKTSNLLLIQNFVNVDKTKTVYCKFQRKDLLAAKKFFLYTKIFNSDEDLFEQEGFGAPLLNGKGNFNAHHPQRSHNFSMHSGINFNSSSSNFNNNNNVNNQTNNSSSLNNINSPANNNINNNNLNLNGSGSNFSSFNNNNNNNNNNNTTNNLNNNNTNNQINNTASHKNTHSKSNNTLGNAVAKKPLHLQKKKATQTAQELDDEEEKVKKQIDITELIPLNDQNLTEYMASICEPFVELLEKSLGIFIYEVMLMFHKDFSGNFYFRLCDSILSKSRLTPQELEEEQRLKENMKCIFEKAIPKEIRKNVRKYEKVSKNAFCFGEFCNYNIPKFFINMNKFNKEDLIEYKNIDSKLIERNKNHDFAFILPNFIIKKAYDNENLVNIVLKAYSIFPMNFDRDQVLLQLQKEKQLEEERKEEENKKEAERLKMEEKIKRMGTSATNCEEVKNFLMSEKKLKNASTHGSLKAQGAAGAVEGFGAGIVSFAAVATGKTPPLTAINKRNASASNTEKKKTIMDYRTLEKNILSQDIDDSEDEENQKIHENKSGVTLYSPTPGKFLNFNFDKMYSKTHVCGNCNIIYMLVEDFLSNFEDGETQFKSLNKAKNLLLQGEKLRNPFNMGDNMDVDENNDNLLFKEEKTAFSLKKILRKKIREEKYNEMMKNKPYVHQKLFKKVITKKDEFKKQFDYNIKMNPKLLQLNLLAEKSKNKFFNLILNELKNDPKTLNEKMGMQKPKRGFPKSLESLRMHMGINSKIMVNSEYRALLNLNSAKQRSASKNPNNIHSERLSGGYRKNSHNEPKGNQLVGGFVIQQQLQLLGNVNNNATNNSFNSHDVNIFQEYMKIKHNFKPEIKRLKSQVLDSNQLMSFKGSFKNRSGKGLEEELSELEQALLRKQRAGNDLLNNIREVHEQEAEKEHDNSTNEKKISHKEKKQNNSDSEEFNIYNQNKSKQENSYNEYLSGDNYEEADFNNNNNNKNENLFLNQNPKSNSNKRNTHAMDLAEYEKLKSKMSIEASQGLSLNNQNSKAFSPAAAGSVNKAFSDDNSNLAGDVVKNDVKNLGLERKHSVENEKTQRRTSLMTYKKSLNSFAQLGVLNCEEVSNSDKSKIENAEPINKANNNINTKINGNFDIIPENKSENTNHKQEGDSLDNNNNNNGNNENKNYKNLNSNKNRSSECDKVLMNIYDYFFPYLHPEDLSRNKKNLRSTLTDEQQLNFLPELKELKHYDSDTDISKMRKFVYEKLENIQKEVILKSKFNSGEKNNFNSINRIYSSSNNCNSDEIFEGNLACEDEEQDFNSGANVNAKYFSNDQIRKVNFHFNSISINNKNNKDRNSKRKNSDTKINNEKNSLNKSKDFIAAEKNENANDINDNNNDFDDSRFDKNENLLNEENEKEKKKIFLKKTSAKGQEFSKKSYITSIFYYDWAKDPNKYEVPYYFYTTPLMRLNENNVPTSNNPLDEMKTMSFDDLMKIGKFNLMNIPQRTQKILKKSKVFVYDQFTAIPYKITDLRLQNQNQNQNNNNSLKLNNNNSNLNDNNDNKNNNTNDYFYPNINNNFPFINQSPSSPYNNNNCNFNNNNEQNSNAKKPKILVVVLNDFFDCYTNHFELITNALSVFNLNAERFKIINFNFPAQPFTLYNKKNIFNNIYFSKFLDRFLFSLMERNVFDHTYSIVFVGFGNGGHIALNYVAANEKFFDFINSVIMLNSYCENDENIGKSMLEISKVIENSKNESMIDFFIKSITYNPIFLTQVNNFNVNKKNGNFNATQLPSIEGKSFRKGPQSQGNTSNINDFSNVNNYNNNNNNYNNFGELNCAPHNSGDIINKINHFLPMANQSQQNGFNYSNYASGDITNIHNNNVVNNNHVELQKNHKENLSNIKDLNKLSFHRLFEKNAMGNPEDSEIKLSYQGYNLITKGYFYNIPFNYREITTPIVAFHTSNNCFIPLTNLNNLFFDCNEGNIDFSGLNNFAVKDPRSTMSPISSIDDFSEIGADNKVRRKLVVCEGAHNLLKENPATVTTFLRNFFEYSFEKVFGSQKN